MEEIMNFDKYQKFAKKTSATAKSDPTTTSLMVSVLGLIGESAEVSEHIKKHFGHGHELCKTKMIDELGDVLWYISDICTQLKIDLGIVAELNIEKLQKRYPEGFKTEDSINREV
jgi:NTP pyrophosphatase (non-canonical NTP hydrolase)